MRRTNTQNGAKFTVRGQPYIQVGSFEHAMSGDRFVRVLELKTDCPECGASFEVTASLRQIENRILTRRCERCRKIHSGPVDVRKIKQRKAKKEAKERERRRRQMVLRGAKRRLSSALPIQSTSPSTMVAAAVPDAFSIAPERQLPAPTATSPVTPAAALDELNVYRRALDMVD